MYLHIYLQMKCWNQKNQACLVECMTWNGEFWRSKMKSCAFAPHWRTCYGDWTRWRGTSNAALSRITHPMHRAAGVHQIRHHETERPYSIAVISRISSVVNLKFDSAYIRKLLMTLRSFTLSLFFLSLIVGMATGRIRSQWPHKMHHTLHRH